MKKYILVVLVLLLSTVVYASLHYNKVTISGVQSGAFGVNDTHIYLYQSMYRDVIWNLTGSDYEDYNFYVKGNVIITPVGGEIK